MRDIFGRVVRSFFCAFGEALGLFPRGGQHVFDWRDRHLQAAMAAGLPVWLIMGLTLAPWLHQPQGVAAWVSLLLWQPVLEEALFRGLIQGFLKKIRSKDGVFMGISWSNLATSALFAGAHLLHQPLPWALSVLLPSLVLGYLRDRYGSVWGSLLLHVFYNAGFALTAVILHGL